MDKNDTNIISSSYFSGITTHFYEDTVFTESVGRKFGTGVNKDYFLAISLLCPSDMIVAHEDKYALMELLTPIVAYGPLNKPADSPQFITYSKGTAFFLAAHTKEELLNTSTMVCDKVLELLKKSLPGVFIRIGIDTLENGLTGAERIYQDSLRAVNVGEEFEKEHRVLDFIGMEVYSTINTMAPAYEQSLINTILLQLTDEEQMILGKYCKCEEQVPAVVAALHISEAEIRSALCRVKGKAGLDVNDTEDDFKLNFIMIVKRMLEEEKKRR